MSNHMGSYMLNQTLSLLENQGILDSLNKEQTLELLEGIRDIGNANDCNDGEILEDIGERLGVCYFCWDYSSDLEHGICREKH